jgi:hypothetical protein
MDASGLAQTNLHYVVQFLQLSSIYLHDIHNPVDVLVD